MGIARSASAGGVAVVLTMAAAGCTLNIGTPSPTETVTVAPEPTEESPGPVPTPAPGRIDDEAGVLDDQELTDAGIILGQVSDMTDYRLYATFVDSFDGSSGKDWANGRATTMELATNDVLLAVAVDDEAYGISVASNSSLPDSTIDDVEEAIAPPLKAHDWLGAIDATADVLQEAQ